jgi:hypothetical protein
VLLWCTGVVKVVMIDENGNSEEVRDNVSRVVCYLKKIKISGGWGRK